MDQMVVYRVECPNSRLGMYFARDNNRLSVASEEMCTDRHPGPWSDGRLKDELKSKQMKGETYLFDDNHKFGFASKKQMRDWVHKDEWKAKLAEQGLIVAKYLIPKEKVAIGRTQAIFDPSNAKLVATMSPTKI
jgi:hypothetical protein